MITSAGGCEDPICSFAGNFAPIAPGETATLSWIADPTASVSIDQGVGNVDDMTNSGIGTIQVNPTQNTTYTLTSTRGADVDTATVTVTIGNVASFSADPLQVLPNAVASLSWQVDPAASVTIDKGVGNVDANTEDGVGTIQVNPAVTTTYTLTSTRGADVETAEVTIAVNSFTRLWMIGDDDGDQDEFEIESAGGDFFYLENGDYTGLDPAGEVWTSGPEPWSDGVGGNDIGFERALTEADPDINIYFQLDSGQADSETLFQLNAEFADAEGGSSHDLEFLMNGNSFHTETEVIADGANEVLLSPTFTGADVGAVAGSNVLTLARTDGAGAWIQLDYVELKAKLPTCTEPICSYTSPNTFIAPGESSDLFWNVDPTASVTIDQGIGNVDAQTVDGLGSIEVSPTADTTYTITSTRGPDVEQTTFTVVFVDLALLWSIGDDNNGQSEFEHEDSGDDFFYVEDGDYSETTPDDGVRFGDVWEDGPEPWNDGIGGNEIGFERALTTGDPDINVFFQLEPNEANAASISTFTVEFRSAEADSMHNIDLLMNGNSFQMLEDVVADGSTEVLVSESFTGEDVAAQPGPNVLTIARTDGAGAWIQLDYLRLEVQSIASSPFEISNITLADGDVMLTWNSVPGKFYTIDYSPDLNDWEEATDGLPSGGTSTGYTDTFVPDGTQERYYRVTEE